MGMAQRQGKGGEKGKEDLGGNKIQIQRSQCRNITDHKMVPDVFKTRKVNNIPRIVRKGLLLPHKKGTKPTTSDYYPHHLNCKKKWTKVLNLRRNKETKRSS